MTDERAGTYRTSKQNIGQANLGGFDFPWEVGVRRLFGYEAIFPSGRREGFTKADGLVTVWDSAPTNWSLSVTANGDISGTNDPADDGKRISVRGLSLDGDIQITLIPMGNTGSGTWGSIGGLKWKVIHQMANVEFADNVGDIIVVDEFGGVMCTMLAGENLSFNGFFVVPSTHVGMIKAVHSVCSQGVRTYLSLAREGTGPKKFLELLPNGDVTLGVPLRIRPGLQVEIVAEAPAGQPVHCSCSVDIILYDHRVVKVGDDFPDEQIPE